jgi:2-dehydro-3-deoxygluconokinase
MNRFDITSLGEAMLRLSVPAGIRLETAKELDVHVAGAEANVASLCARLGWRSGWMSSLPTHPLGRMVAHQLRQAGVDITAVQWADGRLGTYFIEFATPPRQTQATYDRADSCFTKLQPADIPWDYLLDTRLLHLTGITPPLSPGCLEVVREARQRARENGVAISFDVNYRSKLWSAETAAGVLRPLMQQVDLLFCSRRDAQTLFGCTGSPAEMLAQLLAQTQARKVVMTLAEEGVLGGDGTKIFHEPARPVGIIDRIGAGDALAAGVIHGWLADDFAAGLRYGVTLAAMALSQHGDMVVTNRTELEALVGETGGDVLR